MSVPTFPEGATQLPLENLGSARHWQGVGAHIDGVRAFVFRNPLLAEGYESGRVDRRASFYNDNYMNRFPPVRVGNADHRTLQDPRILRKA